MLRDYVQRPDVATLTQVVGRFNINCQSIKVVQFKVLTPDSFAWELRVDGSYYCLYAEDYIPNLAHVERFFNNRLGLGKWQFVRPKLNIENFEDTSVALAAEVYDEPEPAVLQMAVDSGFDLVFLARISN